MDMYLVVLFIIENKLNKNIIFQVQTLKHGFFDEILN